MIVASRARSIVNEDSRPVLPRYVRIRFDKVRQRHVVLAPEKLYWPDEIGIAILDKCDGERSLAQIAALLAADYDAPYEIIFNDVLEFAQEWSDRLLLKI
ncbi:MAG TPA: pyrroloquinoline quinone biosynthesis peptide chaperone PqqD [Hyphomicrobiales bacterium]|nr:pyrroloquinoline quinone biosynthesis peptide chaperone PqqD [Hyphomicrobiales bacterium]